MTFKAKADSTRFIYIQEGIAVGLIGAFAKVIWPGFPVIELYGFMGPIILGAYGLKTWGHSKDVEAEVKDESKEDTEEIPVR